MGGIVVAGHICVDLAPALSASARIDPGSLIDTGPLRISLGGCVANTGLALADLGSDVRLHATVGDDELGSIVASRIAAHERLHPALEVTDQAATSYSVVVEPAGLDRTFWHHTGANELFTGEHLAVGDADLVHLGYPPLLPGIVADDARPLVALLDRVRRGGATTSMDLAVVDPDSAIGALDWERILRRVLPLTDVVSPSIDDLRSALGAGAGAGAGAATDPLAEAAMFAELLLEWGAAVVAISAGEAGLLLRTADAGRLQHAGRLLEPLARMWADVTLVAPPVPAPEFVSTNGAGDTSTAALLFALSRGAGPELATELAGASAALVIAGRRPTPAELLRLRPRLSAVFEGVVHDPARR
ncbi:MAG TPA: carbohydrate kinase family protein [Plantibacter sp.]|uniref:carbohydrate kinase family protein n=1 Tax=unclassified Plantibacter TaxID=2624265 RepID=UPI002B6E7D90|nr:carbohydrate kinase family protein [Plantibacter sp.]